MTRARAWASPRLVRFQQELLSTSQLSDARVRLTKALRGFDARSLLTTAIEHLRHGAQFAARHAPHPRLKPTLVVLAALLALVAGYAIYCLATLSIGGGLVIEATPSALVVEADNGQAFATRGVFKGEKLSAGDVPADLARAVIAIEDRRFYQHGGIDVRGIMRAAARNIAAGGAREGASTITQQLVRMTYLSPERTLKRKVQEAMVALWLEHQLSKEEILVRYLNTAYFGAGVYGVDAAAKRYFGRKLRPVHEEQQRDGGIRQPADHHCRLAAGRQHGGQGNRQQDRRQELVDVGLDRAD